ncbi:MAG TPA: hypothetical protein VK184_15495 [Nostocaceae cyanobacterium]|nr:hypothetical protein [Nostocaceae cyanobacterium]
MNINFLKWRKFPQMLGLICGSLVITLPIIGQKASAQQRVSALNPCPGIYYEEPYNNRMVSPQNCPPNAFSLRQLNQGFIPSYPPTSQTPTPEQTRLGVGGEDPRMDTGQQIDSQTPRSIQPTRQPTSPPTTQPTLPPTTQPTLPPTTQPTFPPTTQPTFPPTTQPTSPPTTQPTFPPTTQPTSPPTGTQRPTPRQRQTPRTGGENRTMGTDQQIQGQLPDEQTPTQTTPAPSQRQNPATRIALENGKVNIRLFNDTGGRVNYQVIGDTRPRALENQSGVVLQDLSAPVTVTLYRQDRGLLRAIPQPSRERGTLDVTLQGTTDKQEDTRALRIQRTGAVFLN